MNGKIIGLWALTVLLSATLIGTVSAETFFITPECAQKYGVRFTAAVPGNYELSVLSGAWNPWPTGHEESWSQAVYFYKNSEVNWASVGPENQLMPVIPDRIITAVGQSTAILMDAGDYLVMTAPDVIDGYCRDGCRGGIDVQVIPETGSGILMVPGGTGAPTDPDHDGIYEDINGNGRLDFADIVLYINMTDWMKDNEPVSAFDLNGNGRIDFADIVDLFNEV